MTHSRLHNAIVIGGWPTGSLAAELIGRGGGAVTVFEEKLGWEKPCGGELTQKALQRYPSLLPATGEGKAVREVEFVPARSLSVLLRA